MDVDVEAIAVRWSLRLGEPYEDGQTSRVLRATSAEHGDVVLKVIRRHYEAEHEADGLRFWEGDGAVRLHGAEVLDDETAALLLERCEPGTQLRTLPESEHDVVIAGLLERLWRVPDEPHPFRSLALLCEMWADAHDREVAARPLDLDPGLVREGMHLFRTLPDSAERHVLLCTDLHAGNVVAAQREPWLMIDPKPYLGDPTYDAVQHLLNCDERLRTDPLALVARVAELFGLDRDRLRLWLFARCVQESPGYPVLRETARAVAP